MNRCLHIANPNKFTVPLYEYIIEENRMLNHSFLFISDKAENIGTKGANKYCFKSPISRNILDNIYTFYKLCSANDVIILHGAQVLFLFLVFPWFIPKTAWVINGADLYNFVGGTPQNRSIRFYLSRTVLKRIRLHLTHIEGDSKLANKVLGGNASYCYTPMYLSNVVSTRNFSPTKTTGKVNVMVGNSNSVNNNHISIFNNIKRHEKDIERIICPLSYGTNMAYKASVIQKGKELFGTKFEAIENFMPLSEYEKLLKDIDIAVFDHWRQEAMGVTLTLLSLGKVVYLNPNTTSFKSLTQRGVRVFDNDLLFRDGPGINRSISANKELLEVYYSNEVLLDSLKEMVSLF